MRLFGIIKQKYLLAKWTNKDPSTSLSCTKGMNNEVVSFKMWNNNTVVTRDDTYASRSGECRHSQNEPELNFTISLSQLFINQWVLDGTIMKEESLVTEWNNNTVVTQNDTQASRSGKCCHSQNEPNLRSHNITEPYMHKP